MNQPATTPKPTLTVAEAARILQVTPATVYAWIRDDGFPHLRFGGRIRIPTAKLADLLGTDPVDLINPGARHGR